MYYTTTVVSAHTRPSKALTYDKTGVRLLGGDDNAYWYSVITPTKQQTPEYIYEKNRMTLNRLSTDQSRVSKTYGFIKPTLLDNNNDNNKKSLGTSSTKRYIKHTVGRFGGILTVSYSQKGKRYIKHMVGRFGGTSHSQRGI